MNEIFPQLLEVIQPAMLTIIESVVAVAVPLIVWKLNAMLKAKTNNVRFRCAIDAVSTIAEASVLEVGQTYVKGVRRDGKWNGKAAGDARKLGLFRMREMFGPKGLKNLKGCMGQDDDGINSVLNTALELAVVKLKHSGLLPSGGHEDGPIQGAQPAE